MTVFVDTSAVYALLDRDDSNHAKAKRVWRDILDGDTTLATTNYVLIETFALIRHRLGLAAVRGFEREILPVINVEWIQEAAHRAAVGAFLAASRRTLSLVDCASFEAMRTLGITEVFTFDRHFAEQGFRCWP